MSFPSGHLHICSHLVALATLSARFLTLITLPFIATRQPSAVELGPRYIVVAEERSHILVTSSRIIIDIGPPRHLG